MSGPFRSGVKRLVQKILGQDDVRGFLRKQKLRLAKQIHQSLAVKPNGGASGMPLRPKFT